MVLNQAQEDNKIRLENNRHSCDQLVYMYHTQNLLDKNQPIAFQQKNGTHKVIHHRSGRRWMHLGRNVM